MPYFREGPFQRIVAVNFPDDDTGEHAPGEILYSCYFGAGLDPGYTGSDEIAPYPARTKWSPGSFEAYIWSELPGGGYGWNMQYSTFYPIISGGNSNGGAGMREVVGQPTTRDEILAGVNPRIYYLDVSPTVGLGGAGSYGYNWAGTGCLVDVATMEYDYLTKTHTVKEVVPYSCDFSVFTLQVNSMLFRPSGFTFEIGNQIIPQMVLQYIGNAA